MISDQLSFIILISLFALGAISAIVFRKNDKIANYLSNGAVIIASIWGIAFALNQIITGVITRVSLTLPVYRVISLSFVVDSLSAFFILIISLVSLFASIYAIGYVKHYYGKYNIGALGFFYNTFILGMILVVSASNAIFFLVAWEIMSVASYFLVIYDRNDTKNIRAGLVYLIMTHAATSLIIILFLTLYRFTGSFDFEGMRIGMQLLPANFKDVIFVLALIGFGTKSGVITLHIWLPGAHPAAPSHVSALMSGVMIKTGIFMMIRLFLDILQPIPVWWGYVVLIVGAASALIGVILALTEYDIKRVLAFSSIENIGIILLGVGSAMIFSSMGLNSLALIGLIAALFHTLNHAVFKSLLFMGAGSIINETHTRNMEEYGGIIKYMPITAFLFLIGTMAISALPLFNGFYSEWMTFQALFQGISSADIATKISFSLAAGSLAFTGGFALMCFVRLFGVTFLARPRSDKVQHAEEKSISMLLGMAGFAALAILIGIFSTSIIHFIDQIVRSLSLFKNNIATNVIDFGNGVSVSNGFAGVSGLWIVLFIIVATLITILIFKYFVNSEQKIVVADTWDCGTDLTPRMEITATAFSSSIVRILKKIIRPKYTKEVKYQENQLKYYPESIAVNLAIKDIYEVYLFAPLYKAIKWLSSMVKKIQTGSIHLYILYVLLVLLITLIIVL